MLRFEFLFVFFILKNLKRKFFIIFVLLVFVSKFFIFFEFSVVNIFYGSFVFNVGFDECFFVCLVGNSFDDSFCVFGSMFGI